jgi:hypothetical protein
MPLNAITTTRLHLLLAAGVALSGSTYAVGVAALVVAVTLLRVAARHRLLADPGAAVLGAASAGVLAAPQHPDVLDPAGSAGQRLAGLAQP